MMFPDFSNFSSENLTDKRNYTEQNWSTFLQNPNALLPVRSIIYESWKRCLSEGLNPLKSQSDSSLDETEAKEILQASQLYEFALPVLQEVSDFAKYTGYLLTLSDYKGRIIYLDGDDSVIKKAEQMNFSVGADWSERAIGTNAIGTSLALQRPVQIFAAEHFCSGVHDWVCSAAPIYDPINNEILGIIDATGLWKSAQSHTAAFIESASKLIQERFHMHAMQARVELMQQYSSACSHYPGDGVIVMDGSCQLVEASPTARNLAMTHRGEPINRIWNAPKVHQEVLRKCRGEDSCTVQLHNLGLVASIKTVFYAGRRIGFILVTSSQLTEAKPMPKQGPWAKVIGKSDVLLSAINKGEIVAQSDVPVLLEGESGVGKELFAHAIHESSSRRTKPFISINCGAIPKQLMGSELFGYEPGTFTGASRTVRKGKFEEAQGGTLFLDEIGEMPLDVQVYLLRVIQEREIVRLGSNHSVPLNVRIIAATNRSLEEQVLEGSFRMDLLYRLNVVTLKLPALRDRREDIPMLVHHILQTLTSRHGKSVSTLHPTVSAFLYDQYSWPGNVRELWNVIEYMILFSDQGTITWRELPPNLKPDYDRYLETVNSHADSLALNGSQVTKTSANHGAEPLESTLETKEKMELSELLIASRGNLSEVSRRLGVARTTVYRRLRKYKLEKPNTWL